MNHLLVALSMIGTNYALAQGLDKNGQIISSEAAYISKNGAIGLSGVSLYGQFQLTSNSLGQSYQGGIIIYIFQSGDPGYVSGQVHGLIASTEDVGYTGWGCSGVTTSATGTALGTGSTNTASILAACVTAGVPAKLCFDHRGGGYSDWYLPSKDELNKMYLNRSYLSNISQYIYWSSSETSSTSAWRQNQTNGNGSQQSFGKTSNSHIRAMRTF
ncbi:MAG TPA: hypothetical protein VGB63_18125 [Pedobacter sp.]